MKRLVLAAIVAASMLGGVHEWTARGAVAHTASCANSFPSDGHPGPWRTTNNGGTLHGNSVHVDCPTSSTHWQITYRVQAADASGVWVNFISFTKSGNGSPSGDISASISPFACDTQNVYRTHIDNIVTGGTINKPAGGGGVHLTCG